jgi:hypothetical protein
MVRGDIRGDQRRIGTSNNKNEDSGLGGVKNLRIGGHEPENKIHVGWSEVRYKFMGARTISKAAMLSCGCSHEESRTVNKRTQFMSQKSMRKKWTLHKKWPSLIQPVGLSEWSPTISLGGFLKGFPLIASTRNHRTASIVKTSNDAMRHTRRH